MRFSERWLRACVETDLDSDALAHALTMAGLEVEERTPAAPEFSGVVVARVLEVHRHPDADKLTICTVALGQTEPVQIVCGAPNVAAGTPVPAAVPGASHPRGCAMRGAELRGVVHTSLGVLGGGGGGGGGHTPAGPGCRGGVVARVLEVLVHPEADKWTICTVDIGQTEPVQIVCGAPNVAAGITVPCAVPGAQLPGGFRIGVAKMRGVRSEGMLCSARELGLSEDHSGLMLLSEALMPGQLLRDALDLDDRIWLLKLTPNLAHCMSVTGVAREVAAITGAALRLPDMPNLEAQVPDRLAVRIPAPELCGRLSGRIIRGVHARAATPDWIR